MTRATRRRFLLGGLATAALAGCGFQLRGAPSMPFQSIYLGTGEYSEITAALRRQLEAGGTVVVNAPADAQVQLQVSRDTRAKTISSLSAAAQVREYTLFRYFDFRLVDHGGAGPFSPPDLDRRVDSPALSGRGSRPSGRTSG